MNDIQNQTDHKPFTKNLMEAIIRIALIALLIGWCFIIIRPFIIVLAWGIIIAVAVFPLHKLLSERLSGRKKLAATIITLILLAVIIVPATILTESLVSNIGHASEYLKDGHVLIPPPPESIKSWQIIGKPIYNFWYHASVNLQDVLHDFAPQLKVFGLWLFKTLGNIGFGVLQFIASIILCGIFLVFADAGSKAAQDIGTRLIGRNGAEYVKDSEVTIRNVAKGILGVAFIQALLFGIGLFVAGVPLSGLWTAVCLILAIIQLGLAPLIIPIAIYMFVTGDFLTALLITIWMVLISLVDNLIKPILLGRKAPVPMFVVFIGAIGGFISSGIIGLFVGAVVMSLGYKLFILWLNIERGDLNKNRL
ncbi:MAG: AI-2E family transporter [Bacteroidetes bacterium]|nr:AI-2E family transporter [Bacteroidota bacterium]MBL7105508.1 AI-2E family transporter [Bacteroidales bacterium]